MSSLRSKTSRFRMLALLAVAGAALSACAPTPEPTPTPTTAFATEEEAFAAAEETYRAYISASNAVDYADPSTFDSLDDFTAGAYQADEHEGLSQMHAENRSRTGAIKVVWFRGTEFNSSTLVARTCNDVSATDVLNADGKSVVPDSRPSRYAIDLTFDLNTELPRLTTSQAVEDPECAPQ